MSKPLYQKEILPRGQKNKSLTVQQGVAMCKLSLKKYRILTYSTILNFEACTLRLPKGDCGASSGCSFGKDWPVQVSRQCNHSPSSCCESFAARFCLKRSCSCRAFCRFADLHQELQLMLGCLRKDQKGPMRSDHGHAWVMRWHLHASAARDTLAAFLLTA